MWGPSGNATRPHVIHGKHKTTLSRTGEGRKLTLICITFESQPKMKQVFHYPTRARERERERERERANLRRDGDGYSRCVLIIKKLIIYLETELAKAHIGLRL